MVADLDIVLLIATQNRDHENWLTFFGIKKFNQIYELRLWNESRRFIVASALGPFLSFFLSLSRAHINNIGFHSSFLRLVWFDAAPWNRWIGSFAYISSCRICLLFFFFIRIEENNQREMFCYGSSWLKMATYSGLCVCIRLEYVLRPIRMTMTRRGNGAYDNNCKEKDSKKANITRGNSSAITSGSVCHPAPICLPLHLSSE